MANYKTGAQRYNDKMDKIFARARELHKIHHNPGMCTNPVPCDECVAMKLGKVKEQCGHYHTADEICPDNIPF